MAIRHGVYTVCKFWVQLRKYLLQLASVVQRKERIDADILRDALLEVTLDLLIILVFVSGKLATKLHNKLGKLSIFKQF